METETKDKFEPVFGLIGEMGPFQRWNYLKLMLIGVFVGMQAYSNNVLITQPNRNFTCACASDLATLPNNSDKYKLIKEIRSDPAFDHDNPCNFTDEDFRVSVVASFQLVCDREYLMRLPNFIFYFGNFAGSFIFGTLSDYLGRLPAIWGTLVLMILSVAAIAIPMGLYFEAFLFLRFLAGGSTMGLYLAMFVMGVEIMSSKWRTFAGIMPNVFFAIGPIVTGILALIDDNWRYLGLLLSLPALLLIPMLLTLPESPRWLLTKERVSDLKATLRRAATQNEMLSSDWQEAELNRVIDVVVDNQKKESGSSEKVNVLHLFKGRQTAGKSILIFINWMVVTAVYYGVTLNTAKMEISPILGLIVSGAVEILSYIPLLRILNTLGRKLFHSSTMILTGVVCFCTLFATTDVSAFTLSMIGKFFISAAFATIYIFSAELFPTVLRNTGMGVSSLTARVGSMSAPLLVDFSPDSTIPLVVFGCLAAFTGLIALTLPETAGRPMPETPQEAERRHLESPLSVCRRNPCRRHPPEGSVDVGETKF